MVHHPDSGTDFATKFAQDYKVPFFFPLPSFSFQRIETGSIPSMFNSKNLGSK